jgi:hypothetical protein
MRRWLIAAVAVFSASSDPHKRAVRPSRTNILCKSDHQIPSQRKSSQRALIGGHWLKGAMRTFLSINSIRYLFHLADAEDFLSPASAEAPPRCECAHRCTALRRGPMPE